MSTENVLNYVEYNFEELVQQLTNRLKSGNAWKDTYRSSTGQMLIEFNAYVANLILYMLSRRSEEMYIDTARLRSSVINLVRLLNYVPKRKVSSTGSLRFTISSPSTKKIYVPAYTVCKTTGNVSYLTAVDAVLLPGQNYVDVTAIQGEKIEAQIYADGSLNYSYNIKDVNIENSNLFVYVAGALWASVTSFIASINSSKHYKLIPELDGTVTVQFGDNVFGLAPAAGSLVLIQYIKSDGLAGNVYEADRVITISSDIFDEDEALVSTLSVTNPDVFVGGDDEESIEEIKYEAPRVFATAGRLVTREDFVSIIENYAGVANVNIWGENEETSPDYNMFNTVRLSILLQDWQLPSTVFKQALSEYLYTLSMMTVKYEYVEPEILYVIPTLDVKVLAGNTLSQMQNNIEAALEDEFALGVTAKMGEKKCISNVVAAIEAVSGVSYSHTVLEVYKALTPNYDTVYEFGAALGAVPILPGSVRVFVGDVQVAVDDGANGFTSLVSTPVITGTIDYTTGIIGIDSTPDTALDVSVRYQQDSSGDVDVTFNQICKLYDVDITSISYV